MIALAFETSTRASSVAIGWHDAGDGAPDHSELRVASELLGEGAAHARDLLPTVERLLAEHGLSPRGITDVVVDLGPGSYTGLRVGVATALGLAVGPDPPRLVGVSAPEVLFTDALEVGESGTWLLDGRSKAWYLARGRRVASTIELTTPPELLGEDELGALVASIDPGERLLIDPTSAAKLAQQHPRLLADRGPLDTRPIQPDVLLRAGLAHLAAEGPTPPGDLAPLYLRPFAAKVRKR